MDIKSFTINVPQSTLDDLRERLVRTRWIDEIPNTDWNDGTNLTYLKELVHYWRHNFDWRAQETNLNKFPQFLVNIDGLPIHFVHVRSNSKDAIPIILSNGWPSTFVELLPLVPLLTDPKTLGLSGRAFDVIIPSLPGYGFSKRPMRQGITTQYTAGLWHQLMQGLGYERYAAQGGDFGSAIATFMALSAPKSLLGIHLNNLDVMPYIGPESRPVSEAELAYLAEYQHWLNIDGGYKSIQSTKPQTLGYGLNDSPVGLAAWIVEKFRAWSDCGGNIESRFSKDDLLTHITIYWVTQTIASSIRDYYDNRWFAVNPGPHDFVTVSTAIALFAHQFISDGTPPREWAERLYNVRRFTVMDRGAHFAPSEEPVLLAQDISIFFNELLG